MLIPGPLVVYLVGLACPSFADDLRVRLKQADQLSWKLGRAVEDARFGLPHHPAHLLGHGFQPFAQLGHTTTAAGRQSLDLCNTLRESLRICRVTRSSC